ncbi:hypothetical protein RQP46_005057 [Phenoliferia psychrophenolica]
MSTNVDLDRPLDDIIQSKRGAGGRRGGGGGGRQGGGRNNGGGGGDREPREARQPREPRQEQQQQSQGQSQLPLGTKVIISNLPDDVSEAQIKELFASTVGPLRTASLAYNSFGKSTGTATVEFHKAADAAKAYQQYNKRLVDGKRPMKVEIIVDPSLRPAQSLGARLGNPTGPSSSTVSAASGSARQPRQSNSGGGGTGGRRGGRGGGGERGARAPERPAATLESLDAEMADYQASASKAE